LEEQKCERVGSSKTIEVDVRLIAATNKDLQEEIKKGNLREDLYFRINVIPLNVPPLRERKDDIVVLANAFLMRFAKEQNIEEKKIGPDAMDILINYTWPGNVRELKNIIERLVIMTKEAVITPDDIMRSLRGGSSSNDFSHLFNLDLKEAKDTFEQHYIAYKLSQCGDNISKTAETIGIERSHLHRKIKSLKIKFKGDSKK